MGVITAIKFLFKILFWLWKFNIVLVIPFIAQRPVNAIAQVNLILNNWLDEIEAVLPDFQSFLHAFYYFIPKDYFLHFIAFSAVLLAIRVMFAIVHVIKGWL